MASTDSTTGTPQVKVAQNGQSPDSAGIPSGKPADRIQTTGTGTAVSSPDGSGVKAETDVQVSASGPDITPEVLEDATRGAQSFASDAVRRMLARVVDIAVQRSTRETLDAVAERDAKRQALEDRRAIHRNRNRLLTLAFTLVAGMLITFGLYHQWFGAWGPKVGPYSFVITVAGDTLLTAYAYIRRY